MRLPAILVSWSCSWTVVFSNASLIDVQKIVEDATGTAQLAKFATLSTMALDGTISARVVYPKPPNASLGEMTDLSLIHFATLDQTRKYKEIQANPTATLVYYDDAGKGSVTLKGDVRICSKSEAAKGWYDRWKHNYPEGPATPHYTLLRLESKKLEFISYVRYQVDEGGNRSDWRPMTLEMQAGSWQYEAPPNPMGNDHEAV